MLKIFEIGVGAPNLVRTREITKEYQAWLFEPNPKIFDDLVNHYGNRSNFMMVNCAIGDLDDEIDFVIDDDSSYVKGIKSPTEQCANPEYKQSLKVIKVPCCKISQFDQGDIHILLLDMEGSEYFVLKHLISRPKKIVIEMENQEKTYKNPYFFKIEEWMLQNKYFCIDKNQDWTYIKY